MGYSNGKPVIVGKAAVIVIDMFEGCTVQKSTNVGIPTMAGGPERLKKAGDFVKSARRIGLPVIVMQEQHRRDLIDFGRELDGAESVHCLEGTSKLPVKEIGMEDTDYIVIKRRYSSFFQTDLELLLKGLKVETLILVGVLTDVCVHYTFVDAHQNDYYCRVLEDCCKGSSLEAHKAAMNAMEYMQTGAVQCFDSMIKELNNMK